MAKPLILRIRRKEKVPTKKQRHHLFRSDWKLVYVINYQMSARMFKEVKRIGPMETDAHFCNWIFNNLGKGIYSILASCKGRSGFWSFMKVEIFDDGSFQRLPRNVTRDERDMKDELKDHENLQKQLSETSDSEERKEILAELESNETLINSYSEDVKKEKAKKRGCSPHLKSTQPMYKRHFSEPFEVVEKVQTQKRFI